jgi:hypothetical protein
MRQLPFNSQDSQFPGQPVTLVVGREQPAKGSAMAKQTCAQYRWVGLQVRSLARPTLAVFPAETFSDTSLASLGLRS